MGVAAPVHPPTGRHGLRRAGDPPRLVRGRLGDGRRAAARTGATELSVRGQERRVGGREERLRRRYGRSDPVPEAAGQGRRRRDRGRGGIVVEVASNGGLDAGIAGAAARKRRHGRMTGDGGGRR